MERKTFQQGMAYLAAAYGIELSKERAAVYWDQLEGLRDEPFMEAVRSAVNHRDRFPAVAQLYGHYRDVIRREGQKTLRLPSRKPMNKAMVRQHIATLRDRLRRVGG